MTKKHVLRAFGLIALFWLGAVSCSKRGPAGTMGPQGPAGPAGAPGAVGPAGDSGTIIYSGQTQPAASFGNIGDYYLDLATDVLYGPKSASGWGTGFSFKGQQGAPGTAGTPGTQIYSGSGAPASNMGTTGDFYMDTVAHSLYGPKMASPGGWGVPIALQGPAGTANVQYTTWTLSTSWARRDSVPNNNIYVDTLSWNIPSINPNILNNGIVLCFARSQIFGGDLWPYSQVVQLPYTFTDPYSNYSTSWQCVYDTARAFISISDNQDILTPPFLNSHYELFRWVIIPGGTPIPAGMDYQATMRHLGVQFKP
jgi:hypothetical protein